MALMQGQAAMRLLRRTLQANAAFSTLSGLTMVIGGADLAGRLGRTGSVAGDGAILLGFAAVLLWLTRRETVNLKAAWLVVALDLIYVADTAAKILQGAFSDAGNAFYGVASAAVLGFAVTQIAGIVGAARAGETADSGPAAAAS